jgi:hypothetical protein
MTGGLSLALGLGLAANTGGGAPVAPAGFIFLTETDPDGSTYYLTETVGGVTYYLMEAI